MPFDPIKKKYIKKARFNKQTLNMKNIKIQLFASAMSKKQYLQSIV